MPLMASIPHFYCYVRKEFFYDQESHVGEFEEAVVFGLRSAPSRALGFHAVTARGIQFGGLPLHALVHKKDAPRVPLDYLQLWDCFGTDVHVHAFEYLSERRCRVMMKDKSHQYGTYMFTVDWVGNGWSNEPSQYKNAHVVKLDNGLFCAQPNNRVIWMDPSFVSDPVREDEVPDLKVNSRVWVCEHRPKWWSMENSNSFFYREQKAPAPVVAHAGNGNGAHT